MTKEQLAFMEDLMRKVARGQLTVTQALALVVAREANISTSVGVAPATEVEK
jgi:hypothetical protein